MDGKSLSIRNEQLEKLKSVLPEVISEGIIDFEKLKLTLGEDLSIADERYVLNWAGKSDAFRAIQIPTTATLKPKIEDSINFGTTDNLFIEGENLEVLKVLQKSYYNKVKMIYIDPPYNTGNDNFIYPDKFSETKEEYLKRIGEMDEEGYLTKEGLFRKNSKDSGRYHSNWLSMMYPRLFLARNLLRDDGVIFVSIDDNEIHNLRLLMNEIFGEENFLASIVWQRAYAPINLKKNFSEMHDYILVYCRNFNLFKLNPLPRTEKQDKDYKNPDNDPRGLWKVGNLAVGPRIEKQVYEIVTPSGRKVVPPKGYCWRLTKERFKELIRDNRIWFGEKGDNVPAPKIYLNEVKQGITPTTWWDHKEAGHNQDSMRELREMFGEAIFENPKPVKLLKRILHLSTRDNSNDIILDFFAGSGTTAQAVFELNKEDGGNRKFILVQLPEKTNEESEAYKAGYKTIAEICKERIRRVIASMQNAKGKSKKEKDGHPERSEGSLFSSEGKDSSPPSADQNDNTGVVGLGFKVFRLEQSNFKIWRTDTIENEEDLKNQMEAFADPVKSSSTEENMAWEILLKSGYELTTKAEMLTIQGVPVYSIAGGEMMLALNSINEKVIEEIIKRKPKQLICLDKLFASNDQLKTNTVLQMKDANIGFETI
jgi:adenine-specific DNA-methyltransferase